MPIYAVTLQPRCALATPLPSDTLFGALCWGVRVLHGAETLEKILRQFDSETPIALSSTFPYLRDNGTEPLRFFPIPILPELTKDEISKLTEHESKISNHNSLNYKSALTKVIGKLKRLKRVDYVSEVLFGEIVRGELNRIGIIDRLVEVGYSNQIELVGNVLMTSTERKSFHPVGEMRRFVGSADIQANAIDRVGLATVEGQLFFRHGLSFRKGAGLWFAFHTDDLDFWRPVFRYLEDSGLGGDRCVGMGHFEFGEPRQIDLPTVESPNAFVVLSRYLPKNSEVDISAEPLFYRLLTWRGKLESRFVPTSRVYRSQRVRLFSEGSVFPLPSKPLTTYGKLVKVDSVKGDRTVYHSGVTLAAKAKLGGMA